MTSTQEQLLSLFSHVLFNNRTTTNITPDIEAEAKLQAVSTLISTDYRTLGSNIRVFNAHAELTKILSGIPVTTFKGYASAYYYPVPAKRPMGDVDFIVKPDCYRETMERLEDAGWGKCDAVHDRHESFKKDRIILELHTEIKGIPNGADGIEDVLSAGIFGKKEAGRRTAMALKKSSFAEITRDRYPQATGLLLPVYMVVNNVRYSWLLITGKRRVIKLSTFAGAKNRDKLYQQYRLFEV